MVGILVPMTRSLYWNSHTSSVMSFLVLYILGWLSLASSSFFSSWPKPTDTSELGPIHPIWLYLHRFSYGLCTIKAKPPLCAAWNTGDITPNSHTSLTCFPGWRVRDGMVQNGRMIQKKKKKRSTYYYSLHLYLVFIIGTRLCLGKIV